MTGGGVPTIEFQPLVESASVTHRVVFPGALVTTTDPPLSTPTTAVMQQLVFRWSKSDVRLGMLSTVLVAAQCMVFFVITSTVDAEDGADAAQTPTHQAVVWSVLLPAWALVLLWIVWIAQHSVDHVEGEVLLRILGILFIVLVTVAGSAWMLNGPRWASDMFSSSLGLGSLLVTYLLWRIDVRMIAMVRSPTREEDDDTEEGGDALRDTPRTVASTTTITPASGVTTSSSGGINNNTNNTTAPMFYPASAFTAQDARMYGDWGSVSHLQVV